jgi:hypothetical protein
MRQCAGAFDNNNNHSQSYAITYIRMRILPEQYLSFINPKYLSVLKTC